MLHNDPVIMILSVCNDPVWNNLSVTGNCLVSTILIHAHSQDISHQQVPKQNKHTKCVRSEYCHQILPSCVCVGAALHH